MFQKQYIELHIAHYPHTLFFILSISTIYCNSFHIFLYFCQHANKDPARISHRSEVIHYVIGIVGFLSVTLSRLAEDVELWRDIYTLMASLDAIGNMPFAMIQRYNRYRLERLVSRMQQKC